jgi:hypothetical protein
LADKKSNVPQKSSQAKDIQDHQSFENVGPRVPASNRKAIRTRSAAPQ